MKKYKRAITYGTFDLFHVGHLRLLKRIAALAEELYVVVSSDEFNSLKGKKCVIPFEERAEIIESLACVTKVLREDNWEQKISDVKNNHCDLFVMGDDWTGKFDFLKDYCDVIYLPRTPRISTTDIKNYIKN
ncbi:MAG: adenylyltransferase/cytidyltransferase family protein [Hallerella succinigenes]|uniref:adenylyltransferase/cytidyltransferase family protein n=1 Tax=Hallerella succinigenes TaxID=1896222 RepID=UPI0023F12988|nr:adenylyltransferase/cytidyltransferase family protein [Hallerella succinigenes]MDD6090878.1 adenylyltransferase/cytidyltransferase family protein [Hallerella succinigenes]